MNQDVAVLLAQNRQGAERIPDTFSSFIRTLTVGPGVTPDLLTIPKDALAGYTAGGDFHPALSLPDYSSGAGIVCAGRPCKGAVAQLRPQHESPSQIPRCKIRSPLGRGAGTLSNGFGGE